MTFKMRPEPPSQRQLETPGPKARFFPTRSRSPPRRRLRKPQPEPPESVSGSTTRVASARTKPKAQPRQTTVLVEELLEKVVEERVLAKRVRAAEEEILAIERAKIAEERADMLARVKAAEERIRLVEEGMARSVGKRFSGADLSKASVRVLEKFGKMKIGMGSSWSKLARKFGDGNAER